MLVDEHIRLPVEELVITEEPARHYDVCVKHQGIQDLKLDQSGALRIHHQIVYEVLKPRITAGVLRLLIRCGTRDRIIVVTCHVLCALHQVLAPGIVYEILVPLLLPDLFCHVIDIGLI